MRKSIWFSIAFANTLLVIACLCLVLIAVIHPFRPGERYFAVQNSAERTWLRLAPGQASRAHVALDLAERRLADLVVAPDPAQIEASGQAFDQALKEAVLLMDGVPKKDFDKLYKQLSTILVQADVVVSTVDSVVDLSYVKALNEKIRSAMIADPNGITAGTLSGLISPEIVPFFGEEFSAQEHEAVFALNGHTMIDCMSCHIDGQYKGISNQCSQCHSMNNAVVKYMPEFGGAGFMPIELRFMRSTGNELYPYHFSGECSDCHTTYNWIPTSFDHEGISECQSCHENDLPVLTEVPEVVLHHYPGDCINCHEDTTTWKVISFEHDHAYDCMGCHDVDTPWNHYAGYEGNCISCHQDILSWDAINFDHLDSEGCIDCHADEAPADHYSGQCSNCHTTTSWAGTFVHPGSGNCLDCHAAPENHYDGNCTNCHSSSTGAWSFSHPSNQGKCSDCHSQPVHHEFPFGCSSCHGTATWKTTLTGANHSSDQWMSYACENCHAERTAEDHYMGTCSDCHNSTGWENYTFNHTYYNDCASCHNADAHYPGQCSSCHSVDEWTEVTIDHTIYDFACSDCHTSPAGHWTLQCTACHAVENAWESPTVNHGEIANLNVACADCHAPAEGHYPGDCATCHDPIDPWSVPSVDHTTFVGLYDSCTICHETIEGHWPGECANCHLDYENWLEVKFDHTGYTNCKACHLRPDTHTWRGQCSNCHSTDGWLVGVTPTLTPTSTLTTTLPITSTLEVTATIEVTSTIDLTPTIEPTVEITTTVEPTQEVTSTIEVTPTIEPTVEITTTVEPTQEVTATLETPVIVPSATPTPPPAVIVLPLRGDLIHKARTPVPDPTRQVYDNRGGAPVLLWAQETFVPYQTREVGRNRFEPTPAAPDEQNTPEASPRPKRSEPDSAPAQGSSASALVILLLASTAAGYLRHRKQPR